MLEFLPNDLSDKTPLTSIDKPLFLFSSQSACREAVIGLRQCLPPHLRQAVQSYYSILSPEAKSQTLAGLKSRDVCIVVATDAIGMGYHVSDIRNIAVSRTELAEFEVR